MCPFFSSAVADIVGGADPIPSRQSSVHLSFCPLFLFQIDVNIHNNIAKKVVEIEFRFFAPNFNGSLITKK